MIFWKLLQKIFVTFEPKIAICEPSATNLAPNAFLQKLGLKIIANVTTPASGILRAHQANRYEITRELYDAQTSLNE